MKKLTVGTLFASRYKIRAEIGSGGMGTVYSAIDLSLSRPVALKILHQTADDLDRFKLEAKVLGMLEHPNIVKVFALADEPEPHLVMELLEGESLGQLLGKVHSLPRVEALTKVSEIAAGMTYAHSHGIIHRDLKPQNIFLAEIGGKQVVKILDFGLCKLSYSQSEIQRLTSSGCLLGSVAYMSPESSQGLSATKESDIYSLGIVLYEILTGQTPFTADSPVGVLYKQVNEPIPLMSKRFPLFPDAKQFDRVLQKCLAKDPRDRYKSMEELRRDLLQLRDQLGNLPESGSQELDIAQTFEAENSWTIRKPLPKRLLVFLAFVILFSSGAVLGNASLLAATLCFPASLMPYKRGLQYEIQVAQVLKKIPAFSACAKRVWMTAEARSGKAGDRLMLANIILKLAASELSSDKASARKDATSSLQLLIKPALLPVPEDSEGRQIYKEDVSIACDILKRAGTGWTAQLENIWQALNEAGKVSPSIPLRAYPQGILPLNLLRKEIGPADDANMAETLARLADTFELMGKFDEALKNSQQAVVRYHSAHDDLEAFALRGSAMICVKRQRSSPSASHLREAFYYISLTRKLFEERMKDAEPQKRASALYDICAMDITEGLLLCEANEFNAAKKLADKAEREFTQLNKGQQNDQSANSIATLNWKIARFLFEQGRKLESKLYFKRAASEVKDKELTKTFLLEYGQALLNLSEWAEAEEQLQDARQRSAECFSERERRTVLLDLARLCALQGKTEKAHYYQRQASALPN